MAGQPARRRVPAESAGCLVCPPDTPVTSVIDRCGPSAAASSRPRQGYTFGPVCAVFDVYYVI